MANINLTTTEFSQKEGLPYKKGIVSIAVILAILVGGYVWLTIANNQTAKEIADTNSAYRSEYSQLTSGNREVVDFQNRITLAKNLINGGSQAVQSLNELEKTVVPGAHLQTYNLGNGTLSVDLVADNFDVLAKQLLSFKNSNYFSGVSMGKTVLNDQGKVIATLTLKVN